jgi:23S rRNA maturation-related 3'-5' exoribonuclease YhaM
MSRKLVREEYEELLARVTTRTAEVRGFDKFLKENTSWLSAPASTRFHLAYTGGLLEHSVNVARTLLKLKQVLACNIDEESCILVGLFHDLGKVGMPGKPYYLDNADSWQKRNRGIHYVVNKDLVHMDIATRSLYLLASHIQLSDEEAQAVRYHDGQYISENRSVAHRETKLTRLVQYADNWAGGVIEDGK